MQQRWGISPILSFGDIIGFKTVASVWCLVMVVAPLDEPMVKIEGVCSIMTSDKFIDGGSM